MSARARGRRGWLWSGDFGRFWLGQTISNLGSSFTFFALPLLVFEADRLAAQPRPDRRL
jgi:hypothetical protein